jgi:hypothetical protein
MIDDDSAVAGRSESAVPALLLLTNREVNH